MTPKITDEMRRALREQAGEPVKVEDDETEKVYVIVEEDVHRRALEALRRQDDLKAIQAGIDDMEAGRIVSFAEVDARIREKLGLSART